MSKGATGAEGRFKPEIHLNVEIDKEDFCLLYPQCYIDLNNDRNLCLFCTWRQPVDIFALLYEQHKERVKECPE